MMIGRAAIIAALICALAVPSFAQNIRHKKSGEYYNQVLLGAGVTHGAKQYFQWGATALTASDTGLEFTYLLIKNAGNATVAVRVWFTEAKPAALTSTYETVYVPAFTSLPIEGQKMGGLQVVTGATGASLFLYAER